MQITKMNEERKTTRIGERREMTQNRKPTDVQKIKILQNG